MQKIDNLGAIQSISVPDGWVTYPVEDLPGRRTIEKIGPYDKSDISLVSMVRGIELSSPARDAFMRTLYADFHALNGAEILDLREVLEGLANPEAFKVIEAATAYLNSRRIIRLSGSWIKLKVMQTVCVIDLTGDSHHVQTLSFSAPNPEFKGVQEMFEKEILLSISWKNTTVT